MTKFYDSYRYRKSNFRRNLARNTLLRVKDIKVSEKKFEYTHHSMFGLMFRLFTVGQYAFIKTVKQRGWRTWIK